jgi:outer membrane protein OmpA-like peptidoglycan-associated protein
LGQPGLEPPAIASIGHRHAEETIHHPDLEVVTEMASVPALAPASRRPERQPATGLALPDWRRRAKQDRQSDGFIAFSDTSRIPVHSGEPAMPSASWPELPFVLQRCGGLECRDCDDERTVQRQALNSAPQRAAASDSVLARQALRSPGQELPPAVRGLMEVHLGHGFGDVRVHTDRAAARSARAVSARAYTVRQDVVFGDGEFRPDKASGQWLIAHELTHVIQQRTGPGRFAAQSLSVSAPADPAEKQADRSADSMLAQALGSLDPLSTQAGQGSSVAAAVPNCTTAQGERPPAGLTLPGFGQGSAVLPGSGYPPLRALAQRLKDSGAKDEVQVHGFASREGDQDFNVTLSCARASGVKDILRASGLSNPISLFAHGATETLGPGRGDNRAVVVKEPEKSAPQQQQPQSPPPAAVPASPPAAVPASLRAKVGTLDYYRLRNDDFMARHPTGSAPDYYLGYGDKYVHRFSAALRPKLSYRGKDWLDCTLAALQGSIEDRRDADPAAFAKLEENSHDFRHFAYDTHVGAYVGCGLCSNFIDDDVQIMLTPDWKDIFGDEGQEQIGRALKQCSARWSNPYWWQFGK